MNARLSLPILALFLVLPWHAGAQTPDEEALYGQGAALRAQHRDAEALDLFRQLHARTGRPRALAQMSLAEGAIGRWTDAEAHLAAALAAGNDPWVQRNRAALESAQRTIREHLGSLDVRTTTASAELWMQGRRVASLPSAEPVRVVAGTVTFEVRAPGHATVMRVATVPPDGFARETVDLAPAATANVAEGATPASPTTPTAPVRASVAAPPSDAHPGSAQRMLGWVAAAGAGAFLAGGAIAYAVGRGEVNAYDTSCPPPDAPDLSSDCRSRVSSVGTLEALAVTGFVGGGVLAATSAVLLLTAPSRHSERSTAAIDCGRGPGDVGVTCRFVF